MAVLAGILRFAAGPFEISGLPERIGQGMEKAFGSGWNVEVGDASIRWGEDGPAVALTNVTIRNPEGAEILAAPAADVEMEPLPLLIGQVRPRAMVFRQLDLKIDLDPTHPAKAVSAQDKGAALAAAAEALAGAEESIAGLSRAELRQARLILVGRGGEEHVAFDDVAIAFRQEAAGRLAMELSGRGRSSPWQMSARVEGRPGEPRSVSASFAGFSPADLWMISGLTGTPFTANGTLGGTLSGAFDASGKLQTFAATLQTSGDGVHFTNPDFAPLQLDAVAVAGRRQAAGDSYDLSEVRYAAKGSLVTLAGSLALPTAQTPWGLTLRGREGQLSGSLPSDVPVKIEDLSVEASAPADFSSLTAKAAMKAGGGSIQTGLDLSFGPEGPSGHLTVGARDVEARAGLRIWPSYTDAGARPHLIDTLKSGRLTALDIDLNLPPDQFRIIGTEDRWRDEAFRLDFTVANATYQPVPDLVPLTNAAVTGHVTARTATIRSSKADVVLADGRALKVDNAVFAVPNTVPRRPMARATFHMSGPADALASFLASDALKPSVGIDLDPNAIGGSADLTVGLDILLGPKVLPTDIRATAQGTLSNLSMDRALGPEKMEDGQIALTYEPDSLLMKGEAKISGIPANLDIRRVGRNASGEAVVTMVLDEAARKKRNMTFGKKLTGPLAVKVTASLNRTDKVKPKVEVDLAKAAIDDLVPGWTKPAGKPGKLTFAIAERPQGRTGLDDLVLDATGLSARGSIEMKSDLSLVSADFDSVKWSPGDNMRVKIDSPGAVNKITVTGSVIDARPFLKSLAGTDSGTRAKAGDGDAADIDLDLSTPILAGFNDEAITGAQLSFSQRGKEIRQLSLSGRIGAAPVTVDLIRQPRQPALLVVRSQDAGGLLRFADLYRKMVGGDLNARLTPFEPKQVGEVTTRNFSLRDEPAMQRILAAQPAAGAGTGEVPVDASEVAFTKMKADFTRTSSRVDVKDAVIWGPQVGITIDGSIDYGRDKADMSGTFVPAYGLNNMFAQVPLFGKILGGGQYEGLFAVSFRVQGAASAPTLSVNPLSAVAPGIFRKLVDSFRNDGPPTTATLPDTK